MMMVGIHVRVIGVQVVRMKIVVVQMVHAILIVPDMILEVSMMCGRH